MANNQLGKQEQRFPEHKAEQRFGEEAAAGLAQRASDKIQPVIQGARETAANLGQQASEKGAELLEGARGRLTNLENKADEAVSAVGCQIKGLAGRLRERVPQEGMIGSAAGAVADTLETSGSYLERHDLRDMAKDVTGVIRTYPIPSILVGIGLGFLLGRTIRS